MGKALDYWPLGRVFAMGLCLGLLGHVSTAGFAMDLCLGLLGHVSTAGFAMDLCLGLLGHVSTAGLAQFSLTNMLKCGLSIIIYFVLFV